MLYEIYSECVRYSYRSTLWSKATYIVLFITLLTFIIPFLVAYQTEGLWLKSDTYREQPDIHFKYEYFMMFETDKLDEPLLCTTFQSLKSIMTLPDHCPNIRVREDDMNKDGRNDVLYLTADVILPNPANFVYGLNLILVFDYKLYSHTWLQMESLGWVQASSSLPSSSYQVNAELRIHQKQTLRNKGRDNRFNTSVVPKGDFSLPKMLQAYLNRNISTKLENVYGLWMRGRDKGEMFTLSATILYPEDTFLYKPGFWHVLKFAWTQYLSLLIPLILIGRQIKEFILGNRLVHCIRDVPWLKNK